VTSVTNIAICIASDPPTFISSTVYRRKRVAGQRLVSCMSSVTNELWNCQMATRTELARLLWRSNRANTCCTTCCTTRSCSGADLWDALRSSLHDGNSTIAHESITHAVSSVGEYFINLYRTQLFLFAWFNTDGGYNTAFVTVWPCIISVYREEQLYRPRFFHLYHSDNFFRLSICHHNHRQHQHHLRLLFNWQIGWSDSNNT